MFPDTFQTRRLILRPIAPADTRPIFEGYAQDPEVNRYLTWLPHESIEYGMWKHQRARNPEAALPDRS